MEILQYTEEHRIFRDSLKRFLAKEIVPHIEEWEEAGIVPREAWKKMGDQGFLAMNVPEEYGGLGADFLYSVIVTEELTRTNSATCTFESCGQGTPKCSRRTHAAHRRPYTFRKYGAPRAGVIRPS